MKRILLGGLMFWSASGGATSGIAFNAQTPLYTRDGQAYAVAELGVALDKLRQANKPIILFIHGRGNEPRKSLRARKNIIGLGSAVPMLEDQYAASVLLFNWDARGATIPDRARPLKNTQTAAESLSGVIAELRSYYRKNPAAPPVVLLAHSMGTIVVQRSVETHGWSREERVFANVLFTAADADNIGHAAWVEKMGAVERVFIVVNPSDSMLSRSKHLRSPGAMALGLDPGPVMAAGAIYLDIGATRVHEVFNKRFMKGRINVCRILADVLGGRAPELAAPTADVIVDGQRYRLLPTRATQDNCLESGTR